MSFEIQVRLLEGGPASLDCRTEAGGQSPGEKNVHCTVQDLASKH